MRVRLFGEDRVLWRDGDGRSRLWRNRCIHRGMRLHYGFVDGNRLVCRYHGWRFGGDGKCALIPAHPAMEPPDDFRIPAFASREAAGLVWATAGAPAEPAPPSPEGVFCRTLALRADAADVRAALRASRYAGLGARGTAGFGPVEDIADGVLSLAAPAGGETLVFALQPVEDGRSQVHVLVSPAGRTDVPNLRHHVAAWALRFRWFAENGQPADMSWGGGSREEAEP